MALVLLVPQLTGCFQHVPVSGTQTPGGTPVTVDVTDRGRVELAAAMGPGVRRISGRVLQSTDSALVLSVTSVQYLDASGTWTWRGERVEIPRAHLAEVRERRLSTSRSVIAAGLATAGLIAASLISIRGFGADPGSDRPGGEPGSQ